MTDKEKIRAEIERRKKLHEKSLINPIHEGFGLQNVIKAKISELTYLHSFIDSMQEEPKSFDEAIQEGDDVRYNEDLGCRVNLSRLKRIAKKEATGKLKECIDNITDESLAKARKQLQEELVNGGLDLGCGVIWKDEESVSEQNLSNIERIGKNWKEPASEDLEKAIDSYLATYFGGKKEKQDWPFLKKMAIHFANWQKQKNESKVLTEEQCRKIRDDAFELGKDAMKQQLMAKAVDATIEEPEPLLWRVLGELEGLFVVENNLHDGDGVKVIIVKED